MERLSQYSPQVGQQVRQFGIRIDQDRKVLLHGGSHGAGGGARLASIGGSVEVNAVEVARKENSDLRGQVAFFKRRLEARGGRDHPPCWANESGAPEYLFSLELNPTGIVVQPAWPAHREPDARSLPNIETALQSPVSLADFARSIQGIFNASKAADPQCRHYVSIKNTIADAVASDRARLSVENYFYIYEARR